MYSAKNATLSINGKTMDYVTFGKGNQPLVIIPGLGDGLQTVKGMAMPFQSHTVYLPNVTKFMFFLESMS